MAATYVNIGRQEFEDWLFELCPVFERVEDAQGVYLVPLSPYVAVKISATLSSSDRTTRRGHGRCRMRLVARHRGHDLRGPEKGTRVSNRTKGWRRNWARHLRELIDVFKRHRDRYHEMASRSQEDYAAEWVARIESVPGWRDFDILVDLRRVLGTGMWLTSRQEAAVWKFLGPKGSRGPGPRTPQKIDPKDADKIARALEQLVAEAEQAGDSWTATFATSVLKRVDGGRAPTTRQRSTMIEKFKKYGISVPAAA